MKAPSSL